MFCWEGLHLFYWILPSICRIGVSFIKKANKRKGWSDVYLKMISKMHHHTCFVLVSNCILSTYQMEKGSHCCTVVLLPSAIASILSSGSDDCYKSSWLLRYHKGVYVLGTFFKYSIICILCSLRSTSSLCYYLFVLLLLLKRGKNVCHVWYKLIFYYPCLWWY